MFFFPNSIFKWLGTWTFREWTALRGGFRWQKGQRGMICLYDSVFFFYSVFKVFFFHDVTLLLLHIVEGYIWIPFIMWENFLNFVQNTALSVFLWFACKDKEAGVSLYHDLINDDMYLGLMLSWYFQWIWNHYTGNYLDRDTIIV